MRNHSNENEFDLHENEHVGGTRFRMNGFALRLVLTRGQKGAQKWPIVLLIKPWIAGACAQRRKKATTSHNMAAVLQPIGSLSKPRTIAVHVRYKSLCISFASSPKQQREIIKFCVV